MIPSRRSIATLVIPLAVFATACGSSDSGSSSAASSPAATAAASSDSNGGNPEVEAYCAAVEKYAEATKKMIADPQNADVEAITKEGQDLVTKAAALATSVDASDVTRLTECSNKFAEIGQ